MKLSRVCALLLSLQLSLNTLARQQPAPLNASRPDQAPPQPSKQSDDDVVRITTNLVQVDAVITDNKGRLVTDLRPEEVEIREDDEAQAISNFSFVSLDSGEQRPKSKI